MATEKALLTIIAAKAKQPPPTARSKSLPAQKRIVATPSTTPSSSKPNSRNTSTSGTPRKNTGNSSPMTSTPLSGLTTPVGGVATPGVFTLTSSDMAGLHLSDSFDEDALRREREKYRERPVPTMKQADLIKKVKEDEANGKKSFSLIVVGG